METIKVIKRKDRDVVRLLVELDVHQAIELSDTAEELHLTKAKAVAQAVNIWLGMVKRAS